LAGNISAWRTKIQFNYSSEEATLSTDAFRLEQIIHNLVHNAFRYTGKDGTISLRAKTENAHLIILVEDNGAGISKEMKLKVFDRFFKIDENNHEGTGIGLSLVKEYTKSLGGKVEMESETGVGTKFIVTIPIIANQESAPAPIEAATPSEDGKQVMLVVEDHTDLNDLICPLFEDTFQCISAFDGAEELRLIEQQLPDLIISDLMIPEMDGSEFVQTIKSDDRVEHITVVILSAKSQVENRVDLYEIGADNYLMKPFDISELNAIVLNIIEQRAKLKRRLHQAFSSDETGLLQNSKQPQNINNPENDFLTSLQKFILKNLDNSDLNIPAIASELGVGRNKFQKLIREYTGLSAVEFIRSVRLLEAKKLLQQKKLTVSEVAYSVGFNNLSYFTRSFKAEFEVLPSEV